MLSCIYNGKPFIANDSNLSMEHKYDLANKKKFLCPCCNKPVFYCHEGLKISHFVHYEVGDCPEGTLKDYDNSNSNNHERLTEVFVDWIKQQFPDIDVIPDFLINRELKTDVYFELGEIKVAVEIQFKRIPNPNFIERREIYQKNGVKDIWFFITEEENYSVGSPFHRTYYRRNKRELYFYQLKDCNCKIYKGFVKEKWEKIGSHTLTDFVAVEIPLEHIKIGNNGRLIVPELCSTYYQGLKDKRDRSRKKREAQRFMRERHIEEMNMRNSYKVASDSFKSKYTRCNFSFIDVDYQEVKDSSYEKSTQISPAINHPKIKLDQYAPSNQEFKEYYFFNEDGKEYLDITILYQNIEYRMKYLILYKTISGREKFLTCRKETESDNVRYSISINPFLDSIKKVKIQRYEIL